MTIIIMIPQTIRTLPGTVAHSGERGCELMARLYKKTLFQKKRGKRREGDGETEEKLKSLKLVTLH